MASLSSHPVSAYTKLLLIGDSGDGKTCALASLANAGYKLGICDFDNGLDALISLVKPQFQPNVHYVTLTDRPGEAPTAKTKFANLLTHWKDGDEDLGRPDSWGSDWVFVVDSLTMFGNACMAFALAMQNKRGKQPSIEDWGIAINAQESALQILFSDSFKTNVVITAHLTYDESELSVLRGYPSALGSKLPRKVARYFNSVLLVKKSGTGPNAKRVFLTESTPYIALKHPAPGKVQGEMEADLARYFQIVQNRANPAAAAA